MGRTVMLCVRIEKELKVEASEALAAMGLTLTDAVRMLLRQVVRERAIPFEIRAPPRADAPAAPEHTLEELHAMTRMSPDQRSMSLEDIIMATERARRR